MRLGMIARCDDRGLGVQTKEFYDWMNPDVTVVVDMTPVTGTRWTQHFEWYPDGIVTPWKGHLQQLSRDAMGALAGCDVIFSAETFYDPRLPGWLHEQGVKTVLQPNPELYRDEQPTELWWPTRWMTDTLPAGRLMPVPVPDDMIADQPAGDGLLLHVQGRKATGDRNGAQYLPWLISRMGMDWRVTSQDGMRITPHMRNKVVPMGHVEDRWDLYDGCSVLVMPRRYGGLCLPVQEALARGLAVVMTDCEPNRTWPIVPVEARKASTIRMPTGIVQAFNCDVNVLLQQVRYAVDNLAGLQAASLEWAHAHAWTVWEPKYRAAFEKLLKV